MKMFLIWIGFGFKVVIIGDYMQIDLLCGIKSGLVYVMEVLNEVNGIGFFYFEFWDVVWYILV